MNSPLKELRKLAASSIEKAAQVAGVSIATVWNWENGMTNPRDEQLTALRDFYVAEVGARLQRVETALRGLEK